MKCENCKFEEGYWDCTVDSCGNYYEYYVWECEFKLECPIEDDEECEKYKEVE